MRGCGSQILVCCTSAFAEGRRVPRDEDTTRLEDNPRNQASGSRPQRRLMITSFHLLHLMIKEQHDSTEISNKYFSRHEIV